MKTAYTAMVSMLLILLAVIFLGIDHAGEEFIHAGMAEVSFMVGILVLVAYIAGFAKPEYESAVGKVLYDRVYVMALNDYIVPRMGWAFARIVDVFNRFLDFLAHSFIPAMFEALSMGVRAVQSGSLERYAKIIVSLVLVILFAVSVVGWF